MSSIFTKALNHFSSKDPYQQTKGEITLSKTRHEGKAPDLLLAVREKTSYFKINGGVLASTDVW